MLKFNASVNSDGDFVLHFDPRFREEIVNSYAKAKGWQEEIYQTTPGQDAVPAEFRVASKIPNPINQEEFICRLIEQSIAAVVIAPELDQAVKAATAEVLAGAKDIIPL